MTSQTFARHVYSALKPYRIGIPIAVSIGAGLLVAVSILFLRANSDYHLIRAIAPHVSTLVETQDRAEILRMLNSIAKERGVELTLVQSDSVISSSKSVSEMDLGFSSPKALLDFDRTIISRDSIVTSTSVARENGPFLNSQIYIFSPLKPILLSCLILALAVLALSFTASQIYALKIARTIKQSLLPIEELDQAIRELLIRKDDTLFSPTGILELDSIRQSLIETQRALSDATDRLAQNKAKSLVADSYKRLIHDLYTPIAALRETIKDVDHTQLDSSALEKSASKISRLAEQILNQVSAGKENLSVEPSIFTEEDIRSCVLEASEQALLAFKNRDQVSFTGKLPDLPIVVPHDPEILRRAITNLVSNALRACKSVVEVELLVKENSVSVKVSDDGSGIEQSDVGLLLQGRTTSPGSSRPGFGLPSANHIARLHGGRIVYSKSPLGGACFEIRI